MRQKQPHMLICDCEVSAELHVCGHEDHAELKFHRLGSHSMNWSDQHEVHLTKALRFIEQTGLIEEQMWETG
jgi:hypothetical protein